MQSAFASIQAPLRSCSLCRVLSQGCIGMSRRQRSKANLSWWHPVSYLDPIPFQAAKVTQTIRNERKKLIANFCNIVASAVFTTGTIGPLVTYLYSKLFSDTDPALILTGALICVLVSGGYVWPVRPSWETWKGHDTPDCRFRYAFCRLRFDGRACLWRRSLQSTPGIRPTAPRASGCSV
jgi:hypothetical protein